jgi:serralysin
VAKPVYSLSSIKAQLDGGAAWATPVITYATPDSMPGSGALATGLQPLSAHMSAMAAAAFELWDDLIAPSLVETTGNAQIDFAYSTGTGGSTFTSWGASGQVNGRDSLQSAEIWFDSSWSSHNQDSDITSGSYGFLTYLHEIGHALGLNHPGAYDGAGDYVTDAVYAQDTHRYTVMSYFDANEDGSGTNHNGRDGDWRYPATPMLHDIAALQAIYGADTTTRQTDTIYGFGSTADRDVFNFRINTDPIVAIWDAGGKDSVNLSGFSATQTLDLRAGKYSSVGGMTNNLAIAYGATIENATGGAGRDTIYGNGVINVLRGGAGSDSLFGLAGNDMLRGGAGNDKLDGGSGFDRVYFAGAQASYTVTTLADGTVSIYDKSGVEGRDVLTGIEKLIFADHAVLL